MGVSRLDDDDYPALTMGQAAELLEAQPAFLRSLDAAGVLSPQRSSGGHRRYSRRQLMTAARMRELFDEGMTLDAAARIVDLQNRLDTAHDRAEPGPAPEAITAVIAQIRDDIEAGLVDIDTGLRFVADAAWTAGRQADPSRA